MEYAVWIVFIVAMMIIEASTTNLVSIWFAFGALGAILAKTLGGGVTTQICTFVLLSGASVAIAWPFIKKYHNGKKEATNADMLIGKIATVTEDITNDKFAGKVNVPMVMRTPTGGGTGAAAKLPSIPCYGKT